MITVIINTLGRWSFVVKRVLELSQLTDVDVIICYPKASDTSLTAEIKEMINVACQRVRFVACPADAVSLYQQRTFAAISANTEWITFLDDDDSFVNPESFKAALLELKFKPDYIVFAPRYVALSPDWYCPRLFFQFYPRGYWLTCWNAIFPRTLFASLESPDDCNIIRAEDTVRWLRLLPKISMVRVLRRGWIDYNVERHNEHTSKRTTLSDEQLLGIEILRTQRLLASIHPSSPLTIY